MKRPPETLTSPSNPLIKSVKGLERKKERQASGLFLAEGARLVEQGLANHWQPDTLVVAAAVADRPHIAALFRGRERTPGLQRSRSTTFASVGQTFATDLGSLLTTLQNANTVHYVRCLKPSSRATQQ